MGFWDVILPLATINLVTYPSAEGGTTGWTASGGSIAQSAAQQKFGVYSLAVTPTSGSTDGAYYATVSLVSGTAYTCSAWFKGVAGVSYKIWFANTSGTLKGTATTFTATGSWERPEATWSCDSSTTYRVYITKASGTSTGVFYVDALQVEAQSAASTYCDGDQEGCTWDGTAHASTSRRSANSRAGGQIVDLTTYGVYVTESQGIGMPALAHLVQDYALLPGSHFQGTKVMARILDLMNDTVGTSRADLHSKRKSFINAIKPDAVPIEQPVKFYYGGTGVDVEMEGVYDSGLAFAGPDGFTEKIVARFIGYDPFVYELGEEAAVLDVNDSAAYRYLGAKLWTTGAWSNLGLTANPTTGGSIYAVAVNPINPDEVFYGGSFTGFNGQSGWDYLVKYTVSTATWSRVDGSSDFNGAVYALAFGPDGTLYVGGAFTNAGGDGNADYLCKVVSNNISAVKGGGTGTVEALAYSPLNGGMLYFGGTFTNWATVGDIDNAGVYSILGDTYAELESGKVSADNSVSGMATDARGYVWMTGVFDNAAEAAAYGVASIDPVSGTVDYRQPSGSDIAGDSVAVDMQRNIVYVTGASGYRLGVIKNNVCQEVDFDAYVNSTEAAYGVTVAPNGDVYVGFLTTTAPDTGIWVYSGGSIRPLDTTVGFGSGTIVYSMAFDTLGTLYMGWGVNGSITGYNSGSTSVTNNGAAAASPVIQITRTGSTGTAELVQIYNVRTGVGLYFNNLNILPSEVITIDCEKRIIKSNSRGIMTNSLVRSSDLANFVLLPGANTIIGYVYNSSATIVAAMRWRKRHWSSDGSAT